MMCPAVLPAMGNKISDSRALHSTFSCGWAVIEGFCGQSAWAYAARFSRQESVKSATQVFLLIREGTCFTLPSTCTHLTPYLPPPLLCLCPVPHPSGVLLPAPLHCRAHHKQPVGSLRHQQVCERGAVRSDERPLALLLGAASGWSGQRGLLLELHSVSLCCSLVS